jgi:hypothetical protein
MMNDRAMGASYSLEQGSYFVVFSTFHPPALLGFRAKEDLFSPALDAFSLAEGSSASSHFKSPN